MGFALTSGIVGAGVRNLTALADPEWYERMPETVRRVHGTWGVSASNTTYGQLLVAIGIGVASNESISAGSTAVPNAVSDASWDGWLFHKVLVSDNPGRLQLVEPVEAEFQSRAMRKLNDDNLFLSIAATASLPVDIGVMVFVKWLLSLSPR
jgi:hypothetical protein